MPWCPKCKTEYREGFTVCADCGSELTDSEPSEPAEEQEYGENPEIYGEWNEASENGKLTEDGAEECAEETDGEQRPTGKTALYQDSAERASDNRSSAWILLILGVLGLVVLVLGMLEILPIRFGNSYLFYGVMGAIFILFVVAGGVSMKNARLFEKKAVSENTLRESLRDWCGENLDAETIDAAVAAQSEGEEVLYFKRVQYIRERLNRQFVNLDQGFLDQFIDGYVYDEIFGEK